MRKILGKRESITLQERICKNSLRHYPRFGNEVKKQKYQQKIDEYARKIEINKELTAKYSSEFKTLYQGKEVFPINPEQ